MEKIYSRVDRLGGLHNFIVFLKQLFLLHTTLAFLGLAITLVLFPSNIVSAQTLGLSQDDNQFPWHITADEFRFDESDQVYIASGNVIISRVDKKISADQVRFDHKNMVAEASGQVTMTIGEDQITADRLHINLETEEGTIDKGSFFLNKENFHIRGEQIVKTGEQTFHADKASITTCDGDKPAWKITGRNLNVTIEGYGYAHHAVFWLNSIPLLYTPFIAFPVKTKRQTGLLPPQIGSSTRKGFEYHQPIYWAISDHMDATFYDHYMDKRGNKVGAEFRYMGSTSTKGAIMFDYFEDDKVDDGLGSNSDKWGYDDASDDDNELDVDVLRPNSERYWFRMKHDQTLPFRFNAKLDLDIVSDQDYLKEFKSGYTGYRDTDNYYNGEFNRDMDDYNDPIRLNRFNLNRNWSVFNLNAEFRWYDNVIKRQQDEDDTTVQRLPFIQLNAPKQRLGASPFYGSLSNEYTYFYRENSITQNSITQDHRLDVYPRLYLPLNWKSYASLEASAGLRGTYWQAVDYEDMPQDRNKNETFFRDLVDYQLDLSTQVYRIFQTDGQNIDRIKHTVKPKIVYTYIPEEDQTDYPNFDAIDRIEKENSLTYSLTNLFTSRSPDRSKKRNGSSYQYQQFLRLYLEQSYDLNEAAENDSVNWNNGETQEPFSPVYGLFELTPNRHIHLKADAEWSLYGDEWVSHNISTTLRDDRGDLLSIEHRYQQEILNIDQEGFESVYAKIRVTLNDAISTTAEIERDLYEDKEVLTSLAALYKAQCWSIELKLSRDLDDEKIEFLFGLKGLGGFGSEI